MRETSAVPRVVELKDVLPSLRPFLMEIYRFIEFMFALKYSLPLFEGLVQD